MAKLFYSDKPVVGIDINLTSARAMVVDAKKWNVSAYGAIDLDPAQLQDAFNGDDPKYLTEQLGTLLRDRMKGDLPSNHIVLGIPTQRTFSRTFSVPNSALKALHDAVQIEAEQSIPVPVDALYLDYEVIDSGKETSSVLMSAVPKKVVDNCTQAMQALALRPVMIEPSMHSVARIIRATEQGHLPTVIIDVGPATTDIAVLDGTIRVTGSVGAGSNTFTLAIARQLNVPLEQAHQLKVLSGLNTGKRQAKIRSALNPHLQRILSETRKVIRYYTERIDSDHKIEQILVVGGGSNMPGLGDYFTNELLMPARVASPWQEFSFGSLSPPEKQFRSRYIAAAGLAAVPPKEVL